jgi:hypothetical protein
MMKRYRVINVELDSRATTLKTEIKEFWKLRVKELHQENKEKTEKGLIEEFGVAYAEAKIRNFMDLGNAPFSILAFHNRFLRQIRNAFVIGSYYPALTGACTLGERILNHLLLSLRDYYRSTAEYKNVYRNSSFDNWQLAIDTLEAWNILLPLAVTEYRKLAGIRNRSIHFDPATDRNDRSLALEAIHTLSNIIQEQFSGFGRQPWFIPNIPGASFIKKEAEEQPFVKVVYLPNCALVGPYHMLEPKVKEYGTEIIIQDQYNYEQKDITDEEFVDMFKNRNS